MTKNRSMRIAVLVLALALITCCFVGTTFAKYTSKATGTATVTVAEWNVTVNGTKLEVADATVDFNLFQTIKDTDTTDTDADDDVNGVKLAPGTQGSCDLVVVNASDVTAEYVVTINTDAFDELPIEFTYDESLLSGTLAFNDTKTITVSWVWDFEGDNAKDTQIGLDAATIGELVATASITVTQKN